MNYPFKLEFLDLKDDNNNVQILASLLSLNETGKPGDLSNEEISG
jgi:hypothetical protein